MTDHRTADAYLHQRAETEQRMADRALTPEAVDAHRRLAQLYRDRIADPPGRRPPGD